ncbi:hypothetical protein NDU88_002586 [Pleurodeles waltl]|uniref:Uncharacterized protein n=1 Tax=Pleurodeles waltl TaxID=8319 RepID=A0AAV7W2A0_PLEWA|nr:hypothetical protein NDU88_002586 [Pleurodeles waltl]
MSSHLPVFYPPGLRLRSGVRTPAQRAPAITGLQKHVRRREHPDARARYSQRVRHLGASSAELKPQDTSIGDRAGLSAQSPEVQNSANKRRNSEPRATYSLGYQVVSQPPRRPEETAPGQERLPLLKFRLEGQEGTMGPDPLTDCRTTQPHNERR